MRVAIVSGSLAPIPPVRGIAPNIVVYQTAERLHLQDFVVFSNWTAELDHFQYDQAKYRAVRPSRASCLKAKAISKLPYSFRKKVCTRLFRSTREDVMQYYISVGDRIKAYQPDIIVVHVSYGLVYWLKRVCPKAKIIYYHHGSNMHVRLDRREWKYLTDCAQGGIIAGSHAAIKGVVDTFGVPPVPCWVIHNGVDPARFHRGVRGLYRQSIRQKYKLPEDAFVFIYAGRIAQSKGLAHLIEAFEKVNRRCPNARLVIAGSAIMENQPDFDFEKELHDRALDMAVVITGWIDNTEIPKLLAAAEVGILPSLVEEGLPLFVLECMACGVPMIATRMGGTPEVIRDGENGILVDREALSTALPDALQELLETPAVWQRYSENAAAYILQHNTYQQVVEQFENIINLVISH